MRNELRATERRGVDSEVPTFGWKIEAAYLHDLGTGGAADSASEGSTDAIICGGKAGTTRPFTSSAMSQPSSPAIPLQDVVDREEVTG